MRCAGGPIRRPSPYRTVRLRARMRHGRALLAANPWLVPARMAAAAAHLADAEAALDWTAGLAWESRARATADTVALDPIDVTAPFVKHAKSPSATTVLTAHNVPYMLSRLDQEGEETAEGTPSKRSSVASQKAAQEEFARRQQDRLDEEDVADEHQRHDDNDDRCRQDSVFEKRIEHVQPSAGADGDRPRGRPPSCRWLPAAAGIH